MNRRSAAMAVLALIATFALLLATVSTTLLVVDLLNGGDWSPGRLGVAVAILVLGWAVVFRTLQRLRREDQARD